MAHTGCFTFDLIYCKLNFILIRHKAYISLVVLSCKFSASFFPTITFKTKLVNRLFRSSPFTSNSLSPREKAVQLLDCCHNVYSSAE